MIYLIGYLAVGVVVLVMLRIAHRMSGEGDSAIFGKPLGSAEVVGLALVAVTVVAIWPVAIVMRLKAKRAESEKRDLPTWEEPEFAVTPGDLRERLSVPEVELRERVTDPMGAVPDLPFGHLHAAWKKLLDQTEARDAIWSFAARRTSSWGHKELRAGYVVVRGKAIGPHILTVRKILEGPEHEPSGH